MLSSDSRMVKWELAFFLLPVNSWCLFHCRLAVYKALNVEGKGRNSDIIMAIEQVQFTPSWRHLCIPKDFLGGFVSVLVGTWITREIGVYAENGSGFGVQAIKDGVHVLSLSLGPNAAAVGNVTFTDTFEIACLGALKAGVYVVHAAGNTGPGLSTITSWSPWIMSVGASTMDRTYPNFLHTGDGKSFSGLGLARKYRALLSLIFPL